jgi:hypothetical protein
VNDGVPDPGWTDDEIKLMAMDTLFAMYTLLDVAEKQRMRGLSQG